MARDTSGLRRGGGRSGPNKFTKSAREAFQLAFEAIQAKKGISLAAWAEANPTEFYKLYARLIPVEHVGEGGSGPVQTVVKHVYEQLEPKH